MTGILKTEHAYPNPENLNESSALSDVYAVWKRTGDEISQLSDAEIFAGEHPNYALRKHCEKLATAYRVNSLSDFAMKTAMALDHGAVCVNMAKALEQDALRIVGAGPDEEIDFLFSIWRAIRDCSERVGEYSDEASDDVLRLTDLIDDHAAKLRPVTAAGLARKVSMSLGLDMSPRAIVASTRQDIMRLSGTELRF